MENIRVRFAPSPTGALHIGGIRTALYNYLLAKKHGGTFILRIEDTDQSRYVPGAEEYIIEALRWCGLLPDEGPEFGGDYGPYRQSERKHLYAQYAEQLVANGHAYYAFDTAEALDAHRVQDKTFKYGAATRLRLTNSLTLPASEVQQRIANGEPWVIRLQVPDNELVVVPDLIRGEVTFRSKELDDKVMLKSDGMPTYHLANIVDDYLMRITHVIRGEEWLPSTGHHVLLYRYLGWEAAMPQFAHLPLILKPDGKGKLSKRDGARLGIPVFPLGWAGDTPEESFQGFREFGFLPQAMLNFLAFQGWNPGTEQEIFTIPELIEAFSLEKIGKSGARFDFEKAKWYNQQYVHTADAATLATFVRPLLETKGYHPEPAFLESFCTLLRERVTLLPEFWEKGAFFFTEPKEYDAKNVQKRWDATTRNLFEQLTDTLRAIADNQWSEPRVHQTVQEFMDQHELKPGALFPLLRIALAGSTQGPALFGMMELLGKSKTIARLDSALPRFDGFVA
ncbi:MAG TPA: glutamate--tRNA ligase [Saprospiraceae bacterium]|nr:glutamate--tRNA ligase [Saprospiraceae bacterium]HMP22477.1 glutamate--tRNA ligase [Saprospiraceae bacterium]